jgi:hypothetical protein
MITLTALVALLGLGWLVQKMWIRAVKAAKAIAPQEPIVRVVVPAKAP